MEQEKLKALVEFFTSMATMIDHVNKLNEKIVSLELKVASLEDTDIDYYKLANKLDLNELASNIDHDDLARHVDTDNIAEVIKDRLEIEVRIS